MKSVSILALAATVSATNWNSFGGFNCPDNTDNKCNEHQSGGWNWGDLQSGGFSSWGGFDFSGWTCGEGYGKREPGSRFAPRHSKVISGSCGHSHHDSPSFGCGHGSDVDSFSVSTIDVVPEFDCDLEFHYDMPDGSTCKHRNYCSSYGSTVTNSQCGGAKNVTIIYPSGQTGKTIPKASTTCSVSIPTVSFDCSSASSTVTRATSTHTSEVATTSVKSIPAQSTHTQATTSVVRPTNSGHGASSRSSHVISASSAWSWSTEVASTTAWSWSTESASTETASIETAVTESASTETGATKSASTVTASTESASTETGATKSASTGTASTETASTETASTETAITGTASAGTSSTTVEESTTYVTTKTSVTSFESVSTVYSTSIKTVISCAPEITDCPANKGHAATTTVVVAVSTTICPVTATQTHVFTTSHAVSKTASIPAESSPVAETSPVAGTPAVGTPAVGSSTVPAAGTPAAGTPAVGTPAVGTPAVGTPAVGTPATGSSTTENSPVRGTGSSSVATPATSAATTVTPAVPTETLPCPSIVPACINTWNFIVGCVDNSDSSCYCPNPTFVQNVYDCLYAHGDSDETVANAIQYFQGICGQYAPGNPAVVTAASVTSYLTASATSILSAPVTTIVVQATSSSAVYSTTLTVPQVAFTTSATDVGVIPVASYPATSVAVSESVETAATTATPAAPYATGSASVVSGVAKGTTAYTAPSASATAIVTAGASRVGAGFGVAAIAGMAALAVF